jgi:hypothetical protein
MKEGKPAGYWTDPKRRRQFFVDLAHQLNFDPIEQPEGWLNVTNRLLHTKDVSIKG